MLSLMHSIAKGGKRSTQKMTFSAYSILSLTIWRWSRLNRLSCGNVQRASSLPSTGWHIVCAYFRFRAQVIWLASNLSGSWLRMTLNLPFWLQLLSPGITGTHHHTWFLQCRDWTQLSYTQSHLSSSWHQGSRASSAAFSLCCPPSLP